MFTATPPIPQFIRLRRWWVVLLLSWAAVVGVAMYRHMDHIREQSILVAQEGARNMFRMVLLTRNWNASHGGVYVPITPRTPPNPYLEDPQRDVTTTNGLALTKINPAYMTRLIAEMAEMNTGAVFRLTSLHPIRPENAPDAWERHTLELFEKGGKENLSVENGTQGQLLRYMAPLIVTASCLECHAKQGYRVGNVRGGISVSQRYAPIEQATARGIAEVRLSYGGVFLLVAGLGWLVLEMLRRRWFELIDKAGKLGLAQQQLLQAEKMAAVGQLAAGVAHEINNPLSFVTSNLSVLKTYGDSLLAQLDANPAIPANDADRAQLANIRQDLPELLQESQDGLLRIRTIVAQLKDFSQVDKTQWQPTDLQAGIESTVGMAQHAFQGKQIELVREFGTLPLVPCMAGRINQVVLALLLNAAQAITRQGCITIRTGCDDTQAWIEVADNGCGMSPEVMRRMFDPFFTTRPVGKGTGLGLSVAHDVVVAHGGHMDVTSTPGQGTTVRVWLPLQATSGFTGQTS